MEQDNTDVTDMSVVEELNNFIVKELKINCEFDNDNSGFKIETRTGSEESLDIFGCHKSDEQAEEYSIPVQQLSDIRKKSEFSREKLLVTMDSRNINEILLQSYISNVLQQDDSAKLKTNLLDVVENELESFGDMQINNDLCVECGSSPIEIDQEYLENVRMMDFSASGQVQNNDLGTAPIEFDQEDLQPLSSTNSKLVDDSAHENVGMMDLNLFSASGDVQDYNNPGPAPIEFDQEDLQPLSTPNSNLVEDSNPEDIRLLDSNPLPEDFKNLVQELKGIKRKSEELIYLMDTMPSFSPFVRKQIPTYKQLTNWKSNSPCKQTNPHVDLDPGVPTDKKPKILKEWMETRLRFIRLSVYLGDVLVPNFSPSFNIMFFLRHLKSDILRYIDFDNVQDCSNLSEKIPIAYDEDPEIRYLLNLERTILTIELTLKNLFFEMDRMHDEYEKKRQLGTYPCI